MTEPSGVAGTHGSTSGKPLGTSRGTPSPSAIAAAVARQTPARKSKKRKDAGGNSDARLDGLDVLRERTPRLFRFSHVSFTRGPQILQGARV